MLLFGGAVAAGVAVAVKSFADFDAQMSQVKTLSHATAADIHTLSEAALILGQSIAYVKRLQDTRADVVQRAMDLGATADQAQAQAQAIADKVAAIPTDKEIKVLADTSQAQQAIRDLDLFLGQHQGHVITYTTSTQQVVGRAAGGILPGAPSTRDNMLIHAASGEFVTNARATSVPSNRAALEYMNSGGTIAGYAAGGFVQPPPAPRVVMVAEGQRMGTEVPVNIKVTGESDPRVFAAMAGNAVALRVRGAMRGN